MRSASRRTAAYAAAVLAAAVLPLAATAPAGAEEGCLSEDFAIPSCDDSTPPETEITDVSPEPNAAGWVRSTSVTIAFEGHHVDADTDPIGFECQLYEGTTPPSSWTTCTSPATYDGLLENPAAPYTFRVRAIDTADAALDSSNPLLGRVDAPDYDETPAEVSFTPDATPPNTFGYLRTTYADESGDAPMLLSTTAELRLQSSGASGYECRLDGEEARCAEGVVLLRRLTAGRHRFVAAAFDAAGNVDPTPYVEEFFVPRDLSLGDAVRRSRGDWTRRPSPASFGGDYLESETYGAVLTFPVRNVREILLLAPAGPDLGRVEVRVGQGKWYPVSLRRADRSRLVVRDVRRGETGLIAGRLQLRVASHGRPVRVDAVAAR